MLNPIKKSSKKLSKIVSKRKRKGHFAVYSEDNKRFLVPLRYLNHPIFKVLLEMAEEEYGLTSNGPLRVPCRKELIEFILCLMRNTPPVEEDQKAVEFISICREDSIWERNQGMMPTQALSCV